MGRRSKSIPSPPPSPPPLNPNTNNSCPRYAKAFLTNPSLRTNTLRFNYTIRPGDNSSDVGFITSGALSLGDGAVIDNLNRAVNDTFWGYGLSGYGDGITDVGQKRPNWLEADPGILNIDSNYPRVQNIKTPLESGEYGAGHEIPFYLNYSRPVTVTGIPKVPIKVNSTVNVIRTNSTGNITLASTFDLTYNGVTAYNIPFSTTAVYLKVQIEAMSSVTGKVCVFREEAYSLVNWYSGGHPRMPDGSDGLDTHTIDPVQYTKSNSAGLGQGSWRQGGGSQGYNFVIQFQDLADDPFLGFTVDTTNMVFKNSTRGGGGGAAHLTDADLFTPGTMFTETVEVGKPDIYYDTFDYVADAVDPLRSTPASATASMRPVGSATSDYTCLCRFAYYTAGSASDALEFTYTVMPGDQTLSLDLDRNATIELDGGSMKLTATTPTLDANLKFNFNDVDLPFGHADPSGKARNHVIDTTAPTVDQSGAHVVVSNTVDGTYTVGDILYFAVKFTKPVILSSDASLALDTTGVDSSASYSSGSGTDTIIFMYTVGQYQVATDLDYKSTTALTTAATIRRTSTTPTTDVVLTLPAPSGTGLGNIVIDGSAPTISTIVAASAYDNAAYTRGQEIRIEVTFTAAVTIQKGADLLSEPVLVLDVGSLTREATYLSGNNTAVLTFSYTTQLGDTATTLGYSFSSAAFCLAPGCPASSDTTIQRISADAAVLAQGRSTPTVHAILITSTTSGTSGDGVPVGSAGAVIVDTSGAAQTTVASCTVVDAPGTYGVGSVIYIQVVFTDEVVLAAGVPYFYVNLNGGRLAQYSGDGDGKNTWLFYFTTTPDDVIANLEWVDYPGDTKNSPLMCELSDGCNLQNRNGVQVNHNFVDATPGVSISQFATGHVVNVDTPQITSVFSNKVTSPYCGNTYDYPFAPAKNCSYTVGESIDVFVRYNLPVQVSGTPTLELETGDSRTFLSYNQAITTEYDVGFTYVVETGHTSSGKNLTYVCETGNCEISMVGGTAAILRSSTIPTTPAIYALPTPTSQGLAGTPGGTGVDLYIDTTETPTVRGVGATSADATYTPGDVIALWVQFDEVVVVSGVPFLNLELGSTDDKAYYSSGSGTSKLHFELLVLTGHRTLSLDYIDAHSLEKGVDASSDPGSIKQGSTTPTVDANLLLAYAGQTNSLAANSNIVIDGTQPYITSITSPQAIAEYGVDSVIQIDVAFSHAVIVTQTPYILMETGTVDRRAVYISGTNTTTLRFEYVVQLGDESTDLDYHSDESLFRDATASFQLNGGSIKRMSSQGRVSTLSADLHLNPGKGYLEGTTSITASIGVSRFLDLKIQQRGPNYKLRFSATPAVTGEFISTIGDIYVDISSEFEIMGTSRETVDEFGYSVAIYDNILAVGAPGKRVPVSEVQVLRVFGDTDTTTIDEVQIIETELDEETAVMFEQIFTSTADPYQTVGGFFQVEHASYGLSSVLPVDISGEGLATFIEEEFPYLGKVLATRTDNTWCACNNAYEWTVTFVDGLKAGMLNDPSWSTDYLTIYPGAVTGTGATVDQPRLVKPLTLIDGSFTIFNPLSGLTSPDIGYDIDAPALQTILETKLGLSTGSVKTVHAYNVYNFDYDTPKTGRKFLIAFNAVKDADNHVKADAPTLTVDGAKLTGSSATVSMITAVQGQEHVGGNITLSLRGCDPSIELDISQNAAFLKEALEATDAVNTVTVTKTALAELNRFGYAWSITYTSVNMASSHGWVSDVYAQSTGGNLPPLVVDATEVYGSNVQTEVLAEFGSGSGDTQAWWMPYNRGNSGEDSGQVVVNRKDDEQWIVEAELTASDVTSHDRFGHSVSIYGTYLLVGAPSKEVMGVAEQQLLNCTGDSGTFTLSFRGFTSLPIPADASVAELKAAIVGTTEQTAIHPLVDIDITPMEGWDGTKIDGSAGLCKNNSVLITFTAPSGANNYNNVTGDIEMLTADSTNLVSFGGNWGTNYPNTVDIREFRKGSLAPNGDYGGQDSKGIESGAAYSFKRTATCTGTICSYSWAQINIFNTLDSGRKPESNEQFGFQTMTGVLGGFEYALVSAPGADSNMGVVHFYRDTGYGWTHRQILEASSWGRTAGDRFGHSISSSAELLLVSSPGYNNNEGAVYIWKGFSLYPVFAFNPSQKITAPAGETIGSDGDFGCSVAADGDEIVICACNSNNKVVYTGTMTSSEEIENTGSCYVYDRVTSSHEFVLKEKLVPSNMKKRDTFGKSVAMSSGTILVGQTVAYNGLIGQTRPRQTIQTACDHGLGSCIAQLGSSFKLGWPSSGDDIYTRGLSYQATAAEMRVALEEDLGTGEVTVSRTTSSDANRGHIWEITFNDHSSAYDSLSKLPLFLCDVSTMTGTNPKCETAHSNPIRNAVRSKAHIFTKDTVTTNYVEQCFLFPNIPQRQDMFGSAVAVSGDYAIVGGWNRDLTNVNSGAALVFDLSFLDFKFQSSSYSVTEGDSLTMSIKRAASTTRGVIGIRSIERNAPVTFQNYVNQLFTLRSPDDPAYGGISNAHNTIVDELTGSTAFGRSQNYYGLGVKEQRSIWVNSMFDFRGISDYQLLNSNYIVGIGELTKDVVLKTTNDFIYEAPNENTTVQFSLPGVFPSQLGNLMTKITIYDDDDGVGQYGLRTYYEKFYSSDIEEEDALGSSVDVEDETGDMIVGAELASWVDPTDSTNVLAGVGAAYIFNRTSGMWSQSQILVPTAGHAAAGARFGAAVAIDKPYGRGDVTAVVGAPGIQKAFIYTYAYNGTRTWTLQQVLSESEATRAEHQYATFRTVAISGDVIAIGSSKLECVWVYYRTYTKDTVHGDGVVGSWSWSAGVKLTSSEYDYDVYGKLDTLQHMHRQDFGVSLAISGRTLLVGAPYAEYGNTGTVHTDFQDTDGVDNVALGKGKVFAFYSKPTVQTVELYGDGEPSAGTFKLGWRGFVFPPQQQEYGAGSANSTAINFDATAADVMAAIENSENIGKVAVSRALTAPASGWGIMWTVTFLTEWDTDLPEMDIYYYGNAGSNCHTCTAVDVTGFTATVAVTQTQTVMSEISSFQADDKKHGERFGYSLDIDGDQAVVGAMYSSASARTTWDFESGDLMGWTATGTAFANQPTFGDNSKYRNVYGGFGDKLSHGESQQSGMKGRYYIGTFELRPGAGRDDYQNPSSSHSAGSVQGDSLEGTLTSDPFVIMGNEISFMVGGGCNHLKEYVELLVDGMPTLRATGDCNEQMEEVKWNVDEFSYRAGQIRIVDAGAGPWDHINVDHFEFSWEGVKGYYKENKGDWGSLGKLQHNSGEKAMYAMAEDVSSRHSGAAYTFRLKSSVGDDACSGNKGSCVWEQESRLVPSDKRAGSLFGYSVSVDDSTGSCAVSSIDMVGMGVFKETPSIYPHYVPTRVNFTLASKYEIYGSNGGTMAANGGKMRMVNHIMETTDWGGPDEEFSKNVGAAYIFTRTNAVYDAGGALVTKPYWKTVENIKLYAPDGHARDR